MAVIWLVLTNLYAYSKALNRAQDEAQESGAGVSVVFLIDPEAVSDLVRNVADEGWLGLGAVRNLEMSMLEGYRGLATDILDEVRQRFSLAGISVETNVKEVPLNSYIQGLLKEGTETLIVSGSPAQAAKLGEIATQVEWIEEE